MADQNESFYDIGKAFQTIEDELIDSMIRNLKRHKVQEAAEDKQWTMWQAEQLKSLEQYKKKNRSKYEKQFKSINRQIEELIRMAYQQGGLEQEIAILNAIKKGFPGSRQSPKGGAAEFFKLNERKLEALIKATTEDMEKAETAILRKAEDEYRQIIYNAQVYANTGAGTYEKAVDMATKDFLSRGLGCIQYKNGTLHRIEDYADMAIRTAGKRAYLQGEGGKRQEWGISTVIVNKRGNPCPKCLPFCGKVLIDDVWSGGKKSDGPYPLMSTAIEYGLYHPRCKDSHTTYFPGISTADDTWTQKELDAIEKKNRKEAVQQYAKRQTEKYERLAAYSLDPENQKHYEQKAGEWDKKSGKRFAISEDIKKHRDDTPQKMIDLVERYTKDDFVILDEAADDAFAYDPDLDAVIVNPSHSQYPYLDARETMIHELAHRIDQYEIGSPMHMEFSKAIYEVGNRIMETSEKYKKLFAKGEVFEYNSLISDILGCITDNQVAGEFFHDSQYIGIPGYMELEVFADIFSALYQGNAETVAFIREELPEIYQTFMKLIGE